MHGDVHRVYPGGVYHSTPSVFERLDDENVRVAESLRYYPYRATFDFEYWFDTEQLPSDSDKVHWVGRHGPLSVSVVSNVPGHERVQCLVTDGDTNKLVSRMMDILQAMSDAAVRQDQTLVRRCLGTACRGTDEPGRKGGGCTISRRQEKISSGNQSIQKADGTNLWMDASVTRHRVQFGYV